jgi:rhomboid protease GluP
MVVRRGHLRRFGYYRNALCGSQGGELPLPYKWQRRVDQWKSSMSGFFGGNEQPRPKICPVCGTLVGINSTRCHECGTSVTFSLAALSKKLGGLVGERAPVTTVLLVANLLMFGISMVLTMQSGEAGGLRTLFGMSGDASYRLGASHPFGIFYLHEYWRTVTAMFLHGGLLHIGFNMMALMQFGPALEEVYGSPRYLFLYVVTGAFGFLISAWTIHFSIGASGALLGIMGAILAITTKRGGAYMRELRSRLIASLVFLFALGLMGVMSMDNWAHGGGLAAGFALGKLFVDREPMNNTEKQRAQILGWLAGIAVIACFVLMLIHFRDPTPFEQRGAVPAQEQRISVTSAKNEVSRYNLQNALREER